MFKCIIYTKTTISKKTIKTKKSDLSRFFWFKKTNKTPKPYKNQSFASLVLTESDVTKQVETIVD